MRMCINRGAKVPISGIMRMRSRLDSDIRRMCLSLNGYGTMFILDFFIRWNSTQLMIQRFQILLQQFWQQKPIQLLVLMLTIAPILLQ